MEFSKLLLRLSTSSVGFTIEFIACFKTKALAKRDGNPSRLVNQINTKGIDMTKQTITPQIYVSVIADYNNGRMHGAWINCDQSVEAVWQNYILLAVIQT